MIKGSHINIAVLTGLICLGGMASANTDGNTHRFQQIDANNDGAITQDELRVHAAARFAKADANNDGFLTPDEMVKERGGKRAAKFLKKHDTDGNGALDEAELEAAQATRGGKRSARMMQRIDANGDGKVSLAEITSRRDPAKMFEKLDADGNGSLNAAEFAKASKHLGKGHSDKAAD